MNEAHEIEDRKGARQTFILFLWTICDRAKDGIIADREYMWNVWKIVLYLYYIILF